MHSRGSIALFRDENGEETQMACFMAHQRSSMWISRDGVVRRYYEDTETWSDVVPPSCREEDGCMVTSCNMRLERAMAIAWHTDDDATNASLVDPAAGLHADNVQWRGKRRTVDRSEREAYLPPCVLRAVDAVERGQSMSEAMASCGVSEATLWNYLAKGAARARDESTVAAIRALVPDDVRAAFDSLPDTRGPLQAIVESLDTDHAIRGPHLMNMARILR